MPFIEQVFIWSQHIQIGAYIQIAVSLNQCVAQQAKSLGPVCAVCFVHFRPSAGWG